MARIYNVNPVSFITIDTIGKPGERIFYLQAGRDNKFVTLIIEKQHALALVSSIDDLMSEINARYPRPSGLNLIDPDMNLRQPLNAVFRVGQIGLGYDEAEDLVVLIAYQISLSEDEDVSMARFWGTREQMQALRDQALSAVVGGRPVCELCGEPIDPDGHLCSRQNGHGNHPKFKD
jgi:uncharacterized repeat protein (TIGR03847 family)